VAAGDLYDRIKADVTQILLDLDQDGIGDHVKNLPTLKGVNPLDLPMPCTCVTSEGEAEEITGATNRAIRKKFPVRIFVLDREVLRADNAPKYTRWRGEQMDAFHQRPRTRHPVTLTLGPILPNCPEVIGLEVFPRVIFDANQQPYQMIVSGFVVKADALVQRG
jgi:hypothetical protein